MNFRTLDNAPSVAACATLQRPSSSCALSGTRPVVIFDPGAGLLRRFPGEDQNVLAGQGLDHPVEVESLRFELGLHLLDGHLV